MSEAEPFDDELEYDAYARIAREDSERFWEKMDKENPLPRRCDVNETAKTRDYTEVIRRKLAANPPLSHAVDVEREVANLEVELHERDAQLAEAEKEIANLREVWFAADQTLGCHHCGWIGWPGANGETDGTMKPHSKDCPIGYMETNYNESLAAAEEEAGRLREAARKVKAGSYLDDGVLFRHSATTTSCDALRELFVAAGLLAPQQGEDRGDGN